MCEYKYVLYLQIVDESLKELYEKAVEKLDSPEHVANPHKDSGFDLYVPQDHNIKYSETKLIDHKIRCAAYRIHSREFVHEGSKHVFSEKTPQAFYTYPRSSIHKTPFRVANNVGIIDCGYRGNLMTPIECKADRESQPHILEEHTRLMQICMPSLEPFKVIIVDALDETQRGSGGFGSTGTGAWSTLQ